MFIRKNFITNSSSTCFIAFGALAETKDKEKFKVLTDTIDEVLEHKYFYVEDGVGIEPDRFGWPAAVLYIEDTRREMDEGGFWQSIEPIDINKQNAAAKLKEVAEKYGLEMATPCWGSFDSGH